MKQRLKSPVVWLAVLAQVCIVLAMFYQQLGDEVKVIGTCVVEILTLFGILNNPSDCSKF